MIKRANKITSLLLVAAAVTTLVPATGVNAADYKRIKSEDGTVYNAQAYKGKFVIDGDIKDNDTEGVYFFNDGKYKELEDVDSGSEFNDVFNEKYLDIDGDYFVDLTNGKVHDDEDFKADEIDDAAVELRKKIRNKADDRYSDDDKYKDDLTELKGSKYGEAWFETTYTADDKYTNGGDGETPKQLTVYTDMKGNYIDADYDLGKIKVTANGDNVKIDNTDEEFDVGNIKDALRAKVTDQDVIAQDSKNIYRKATVTIYINSSLVKDGVLSINDIKSAVDNVEGTEVEGSVKKAIKDEAYKAADLEGATIDKVKTTASAVSLVKGEADKLTADSINTLAGIKNAKTKSENGIIKAVQDTIIKSAEKAYNEATENKDAKAINAAKKEKEKVIADAKEIEKAVNEVKAKSTSSVNIEEINGKEISDYSDVFKKNSDGSVSFETIQKISKSQSSKDIDGARYSKDVTTYVISDEDGKHEDLLGGNFTAVKGKLVEYKVDGDNINAQTIELKSKHGHYYTDISDDEDRDLENEDAYDIDVDGNIWALDGGAIYKFDNDEDWDKIYKVDGSMEKLSVYDKNNIVTWNEDDDVYSIIREKDSSEDKDKDNDSNQKVGWDKDNYGNWIFFDANGNQVKHDWVNDGGKYYYLNEYGIMQSNRWVCPFGNWYYLNADGSMASSGWLNDRGTWYYLNYNGNMLTGWQILNGTWYYMDTASGAMRTGWINDNGTWYYLNGNGSMKTGWLNDRGTWYYLDGSGRMLSNTTVNGYRLGANGAWIR
ncbi:cell wall-binding protein [Clostridium taeniosporum]|uniref:Cell wall-binding protein n=1 Tax=Clostridium taeniosporum TaxID=394958 RepID=A0A1D7XNA1_9CLOT|nr:cell wall-binding protein [Clostridium taeniosporum]AOR24599.1 cell wall-binding protein [Clostridium taeniosporum]